MKVMAEPKTRLEKGQLRFTPLYLLIALLSAAFYSISFAQIIGSANLNVERRGHTATLLQDGKVLIVGGENQNGVVREAEIFDPVARTSAPAAMALTARTDHTATTLSDGRVLLVGGRGASGALDSAEIYDPVSASFSTGPSLIRARAGHTATVLSDGKILIAGGDATGSVELYNPATDRFSLATGSLNTPRQLHSAIRLQSGKVLIVGGLNGQSTALKTAEIFDPVTQAFSPTANTLQNPRALSLLRLLPDGKVQIIGGDSDFSMEVYDPQDGFFNGVALLPPNVGLLGATLSTHSRAALMSTTISQDPLLQGVLTPEQLALLDRADQSITELPQLNQALVAGGVNSAGQVLTSAKIVQSSPATITTDKTDYAPGELVTITGTGWKPAEQVDIFFHEFPDEYPDITLTAVADQQGRVVTAEFAPQLIDLGRTFTLTAIGQTSGWTAQTVFTDDNRVTFADTAAGAAVSTFGTINANQCRAAFVQTRQGNNLDNALVNRVVNLSSTPAGATFFSTSDCTGSAVTSVTVTQGTQSKQFSFRIGTAGSFTIIGDGPFLGANDASATVTVTAATPTKLSFTTSPFSIAVGQCSPQVTVQTQNASGTPTNPTSNTTVNLSSTSGGGAFFSNSTCTTSITSVSIPTSANSASFYYKDTNAGSPTITAAATGLTSATQVETINKRSTSTAVSSDSNPSVFGQTVTFTATVTGTGPGAGNPSSDGSVTFKANGSAISSCSNVAVNASGQAQCSTSALTVAGSPHAITAEYRNGANFADSDGTLAGGQTVNKRATSTNASCAPGTIPVNSGTTCTATVTDTDTLPTSTPAGTVTFSLSVGDSGSFSSTTCALSGGSCSVTYTPSAVGDSTHSIGASYGGSSTHAISSDATPFDVTVNKADQSITFGALTDKTYGDPDFTVSATASSGLPVSFSSLTTAKCTVSGNTVHIVEAGACTIRASQGGNSNYNAAPDVDQSFTINKAPTTTTVTCGAGPFTYNGSPHTPCSAAVTGPGGLNQALTVNYGNNTNAGTATASASYAESANYLGSADSKTFTIEKAPTTTTVTCPASVIFNGTAQTPCTALVTGAGGLNQALTVNYSDNTNAGTATASASYAESANYLGSSDSKTFNIEKAPTTTTVTCPASVVFNGTAQTPCTASVTGAGGLNQALTVNYANNTNAGTATASASYAGSANYLSSSDSKTFTINKAPSVTVVTFEAGPYIYRGTPFTATAVVTGVGGLNEAVAVVYSGDCTNVTGANGCTAAATYAGGPNHTGSSDSKSITINQRPITVTADAKTKYKGDPDPALTYQITNGSLVNGDSFTGALTRVADEEVGSYAILRGTLTAGNNYSLTYIGANLTIIYNFTGFFRPIDNLGIINIVKAGSSVPIKFSLNGYQGMAIFTATFPASANMVCNGTAPTDYVDEVATPGSSGLSYDPTTDQYNYVWKTEKSWGSTCRRLAVKLSDGKTHYADFKFNK